jgi:hypothetical protein
MWAGPRAHIGYQTLPLTSHQEMLLNFFRHISDFLDDKGCEGRSLHLEINFNFKHLTGRQVENFFDPRLL